MNNLLIYYTKENNQNKYRVYTQQCTLGQLTSNQHNPFIQVTFSYTNMFSQRSLIQHFELQNNTIIIKAVSYGRKVAVYMSECLFYLF